MKALGPIPRGHHATVDNGVLRSFAPKTNDQSAVYLAQFAETNGDRSETTQINGSPGVTESALDRLLNEHGEIEMDPTLDDLTPPRSCSPAPKRRASSRANMLARGGACEFCKRRKLKCTAEMPKCSACSRAGRECVYSQKKQRSRVRVLEDRLDELKKKLENPIVDNGQGMYISPADTVQADGWDSLHDVTPGAGFKLSGFGYASPAEPDLMTLADAAAADGGRSREVGVWPWEEMSPDVIAGEIIRAVEGVKGVGEKIVGHL